VGYVTFLLDLTAMAEGTIRHVEGSLKFRPDPQTRPANAFAWKVTRDSNGIVAVRALRDKRLVLIAHAKFTTTKLVDREQNGNEPTMHQWHSVEECIRMALAERVDKGGDDDVISEPIDTSEMKGMKESGPSYVEAVATEIRRDKQRKHARQNQGPLVLGGLAVMVVASAGVYFAVGRSAKRSMSSTASPTPAAVPAPTPEPVSAPTSIPEEVTTPVARTETLDDAFAAARDTLVPDQAMSTAGLDTLASYPLRWRDVDVASQTTLAKVEKDPSAEQGKRVCAEGTIERITKKELGSRAHFTGALVTSSGDRVVFLAAGSTGELVKRDRAKLCGVVTGTSDGATAVFGMFDLPENRNPVVEKP
jgi:hypothetical protein